MPDDASGESCNPEHPLWTDVIYHGTMKHFGESIWYEQSLNSLHCKRKFMHFAITLYPDLESKWPELRLVDQLPVTSNGTRRYYMRRGTR